MKRKRLKTSRRNIVLVFTSTVLLLFFVAIVFKQNNPGNFCANSISCIKDLTGVYEGNAAVAQFEGTTIPVQKEIATVYPITNVLGKSNQDKRIEINLSNQRLYAYEGNTKTYEFPVSTGKWYSTPTGTFYTWIKLRYTRMEGGNKAIGTYYNLPNVPYVMYFYNESTPRAQGFGIHGAYWHNNFGHPMSHGCVNMRIEDAEKLYNWADPPTNAYTTYPDNNNPGTLVAIYGVTPKD